MSKKTEISLEQRIQLYALYIDKKTHAGDGIWQRFNFLSAINLALFGAVGFMSGESANSELSNMKIYVAIGGLLLSLSTIASLIRLYQWRDFWHNVVVQMEENLLSGPTVDLVLPFTPENPLPGIWRMSTLLRYTQFPMYLLTVGWCVLLFQIFSSG